MLIITELPLFRRYIATNWPLLSPSSGFVTLGIVMIILGVSILGNLNKSATSSQSLGEAFWRIVIASGILACIMGLVNIFASYGFRHKSLGITARQVRMHGNLAQQKVYIPPTAGPGSSVYSTPQLSAKPSAASSQRPLQPQRNRHRSFWLNPSARRSVSATLPSYHPPQPHNQPIRNISAPIGTGADMTQNPRSPSVVNYSLPGGGNPYGGNGNGSGNAGEKISLEEGYAPVVNGVQRPDLAHHPALQGGRF